MHEDTPLGGPYGSRLLPQIVDAYAKETPERIWASVPLTADVTQGFRDITMKELAGAVNGFARWLESTVGRSDHFETIAYMGASDVRYAIIFFAGIKCGYKTLMPSARNSTSGNVSLMKETKCTKVFHSTDMTDKVREWQSGKPDLEFFLVAPLDDLLAVSFELYPYNKTFEEAVKDPVLICHTSGSTGAPKPIILPNGTFGVLDNHRKLPKLGDRKNSDYSLYNFEGEGRFLNTFPPFHVAGMVSLVTLPILYNSILVMGPAERPASGEISSQIMDQMRIRGMFCPPAILEQLVQAPGGLEKASGLDFAMFSGGPLAPSAGNRLSKVTDLCQVIGATETGVIPALVPTRENWSYFEWNPVYGLVFEPTGEEDVFEMVIPQNPDLKWIRTVFHTYPEVSEWRTKDLFRRHPEQKNLWRFEGRTDDIMVLSNGEKFNPVTMEGIINGHPAVNGALILGQRRFQSSLLIEPKAYPADPEAFIDEVWPIVQKANTDGPAHAKIFRSKIMMSSPEKPFIRAGKGTIVRKKTTDLYAEEIEAIYSGANMQKMRGVPTLENVQDPTAIMKFVRDFVASFLPDSANVDVEDFFVLGLDSLQTMELANGFRAILKPHLTPSSLRSINVKMIYANPTLDSLSEVLSSRLGMAPDAEDVQADKTARRVARMSALVEKYTKDLTQRSPSAKVIPNNVAHTNGVSLTSGTSLVGGTSQIHEASAPNGNAKSNGISVEHEVAHTDVAISSTAQGVILTGSTGSLGTQLLQAMIEDPFVSRIFCLNRSADALQRHEKNFAERGVYLNLSKVEFHKAEFGDAQFGLSKEAYDRLVAEVDIIIHNAWKVDFNHSLDSFEDVHIRGVRNFIDLSLKSTRHPKITFVSSISSVGNWAACHPEQQTVPETPLTDFDVAQELGYGESKHVSERILGIANEFVGVPVDILRVGQIAGPLSSNGGCWNKTEWMPCLVKTSKTLGCIPESLMDVDWIPVDTLAQIILELAHLDNKEQQIYNLVNPYTSEWANLVPAVQENFGGSTVVPLAEWIEKLKSSNAEDKEEVAAKPALKILDWFMDLEAALSSTHPKQTYETKHGVVASKTMAKLPPVSQKWMKIWLDQWNF